LTCDVKGSQPGTEIDRTRRSLESSIYCICVVFLCYMVT
jgi:hypothetical protein